MRAIPPPCGRCRAVSRRAPASRTAAIDVNAGERGVGRNEEGRGRVTCAAEVLIELVVHPAYTKDVGATLAAGPEGAQSGPGPRIIR